MNPFHRVCTQLMAFDNANLKTSLNGYLFKHMATKQSRLMKNEMILPVHKA